MPLPERKATEDRNEFITRCIQEVSKEFPDKKQAAAICYTRLRGK